MLKQFEHIIFMVGIGHIVSTFYIIEKLKSIAIVNGGDFYKLYLNDFLFRSIKYPIYKNNILIRHNAKWQSIQFTKAN